MDDSENIMNAVFGADLLVDPLQESENEDEINGDSDLEESDEDIDDDALS